MIFHNPWGLLALLSLPAILALHFFRSRRQVRRVGGLHLWRFAEVRMPAGRRWERIHRNLPLLFQLLSAALLSLLIAGADLPIERTTRHYTILLDDSASMLAGDGLSAADQARRVLAQWAPAEDRFTVIAAGARAQLLAGPFADRDELLRRLKDWQPESPGCDLAVAMNLAAKFLSGDASRVLFVTDEPVREEKRAVSLATLALGESLDNVAIDFADRVADSPELDRVHAVLVLYGALARETTLRAFAGTNVLFEKTVRLEPGRPLTVSFPTGRIAETVRLETPTDALGIDNIARLAPLERKIVTVAAVNLARAESPVRRAVAAMPGVAMTDDTVRANLVFTTVADFVPTGIQVRACILPAGESEADTAVALGRDMSVAPYHPVTESLPLEGVIWPYRRGFISGSDGLLFYRDDVLLDFRPTGAGRGVYRLNVLAERTNLFGETAWPIIMQGLVEECRAAMPGMDRVNVRAGEEIGMRPVPYPDLASRFELRRDGKPWEKFDTPPAALAALPPGEYELLQDGRRSLVRFAVNLFAPGESDLRPRAKIPFDLATLQSDTVTPDTSNRLVYYLILLGILLTAALAWIYQDISR